MVTLQDISVQLMKPAKDLADWKFPLSQILEEYYALLEEPCHINFGEAALVLQNSANVYVRRIERLLTETEVLKQTFYGYEGGEINKTTCKEKKGFKKAYIDFENFVIIDIEKDIGKHIDKKNQFHGQKKVKLLSHRFTQLENNLTQLCIPVHMYDVLGDIVGKKYDFRCNQAVSTRGMLMDELTPYDFSCTFSSRIQKGRNSLSSYSEPKTPGTGTSGYHSITSPNDNESIFLTNEEFDDGHNYSSMEDVSSTNELETQKENIIHENQAGIKKSKEEQHDEQSTGTNGKDKILSSENYKETNRIKTRNQTKLLLQANQEKENTRDNDKNVIQLENNNEIKAFNQFECMSKVGQVIQLNESDNTQLKEGLPSTPKRGNQTTKISICSVDDINECDWKPMPLIQGIKHVFSHNSPILKLPNYISVLETKLGSKKRKLKPKLRKPECLTKLVLREAELLGRKDKTLHTKQKFKHLQKHELEDFMKNFDECLSGSDKTNYNIQYEAVTNSDIDLLGFRVSQSKTDCIEDCVKDIRSRSFSPDNTTMDSPNCQDSFNDIIKSPKSGSNKSESSISELNLPFSLPEYQTLIEGKMKEIFEESNVTTELDQTVAKWHASLQPKLSEAEIRPAFRIHDYASRIIDALHTLEQKKINFDSVVQDEPACEVARYFLASLQLANTYNVEIKAQNCDNSIEITLLNEGKNSQ